MKLDIVILGLSITSSWGNGHATTYRALARALHRRGHRVRFLECEQPWYAAHRDLPDPPYCRTNLYGDVEDLRRRFTSDVRDADLVIVGSYVPNGIAVGDWVLTVASGVTAFYDIDTPVTLAALHANECSYLSKDLVARYTLYLSFTGGPVPAILQERFGARFARSLPCSVDPDNFEPIHVDRPWDLGYMGTYSRDRQPKVEDLFLAPARALPGRTFAIAGPQYPSEISWPANVERFEHVPPGRHPLFYGSQRFTLNLTRADMVAIGWSPSVRLFEAAACGAAIVSDSWNGIEEYFTPGIEILTANTPREVVEIVAGLSESERAAMAAAARERTLRCHTGHVRAATLERYVSEVCGNARPSYPDNFGVA